MRCCGNLVASQHLVTATCQAIMQVPFVLCSRVAGCRELLLVAFMTPDIITSKSRPGLPANHTHNPASLHATSVATVSCIRRLCLATLALWQVTAPRMAQATPAAASTQDPLQEQRALFLANCGQLATAVRVQQWHWLRYP